MQDGGGGRYHNLKNGNKASEVTEGKIQQDVLGKVNRLKKIMRKGGLKDNRQ